MTKSQLQPGMIAVTRDGNEYLVLPDKLLGINCVGISLDHYNEQLMGSHIINSIDIMQVYTTTGGNIDTIQTTQNRTLFWTRQEFQYPLYCKYKDGSIVKFESLTSGFVMTSSYYPKGYYSCEWLPHTDSRWQEIPVDPITSMSDRIMESDEWQLLSELCESAGLIITLQKV